MEAHAQLPTIPQRLLQQLDELRSQSHPPVRVVWHRDDEPIAIGDEGRLPRPSRFDHAEWHVNEALTNLYAGLRREQRGERMSAMRFIQVHAVDRLLAAAIRGLALEARG